MKRLYILPLLIIFIINGCSIVNNSVSPEKPNKEEKKLGIDPLVTIGKLENGLTYYIRENKKPENRADFRLAVNAGSVLENEDQQGQPVVYQNYSQSFIPIMLKYASHSTYYGEIPDYLLDGDAKDDWHDEIILMRYRSRRDFVSMVTSDEYLKIAQNRSGGIEYAEVTPTRADVNLTTPRFVVLALLVVIAFFIDRQIRRAR